MLTTAVFAICLTAPLGAIFINTLGTKWLSYDGDVVMDDDEEDGANTKADDPAEKNIQHKGSPEKVHEEPPDKNVGINASVESERIETS